MSNSARDFGGQPHRYIPPHLRGESGGGGGDGQRSFPRGGGGGGSGMHKSQSFASAPRDGGFNDDNNGYQQRNYEDGGGFRGGRGRGRGDFGGHSRGGYQGRFSYDRRRTHDEQEWSQDNRGGYSRGGGQQQNTRWNNREEQTVKWNAQAPRDERIEAELFAGQNSGINFNKYEEIPVEATGDDVPPPISLFSDLKLHPWIEENIKMAGYSSPTPVQKYSIPSMNANRDLMSCAQTGSGKTAAFLVPVINHILQNGPEAIYQAETSHSGKRVQFPSALILSPTRELSLQIYNESRKFAYRTPIRSALLYGGRENYREQINKLRLGCHIVIATPGRLIDVMEQGYIALNGCQYLVLDEADRMLDMGFEPQIRQIVDLSAMPRKGDRKTAMFSATFPKEIQILAQDFLMPDYVFLAVGRVGSTSENIVQKVVWVEENEKRSYLMDLLDAGGPEALTVVFVETKRSASDLSYYLQRQGYNAVGIHGDLKQFEREKHLDTFRQGLAPIMVATAVAARGLDIPNVKHVINYDLPNDIDEYVHRIGRTGRVGNIGLATSFFNDKNRNLAREMMDLIVEANQDLPEWMERVASESSRMGGRGGGRGGRGNKFGGRDHRVQGGGGGGFGGGSPGGGGFRQNQQPFGYNNSNFNNRSSNTRTSGGGGGGAAQADWWGN